MGGEEGRALLYKLKITLGSEYRKDFEQEREEGRVKTSEKVEIWTSEGAVKWTYSRYKSESEVKRFSDGHGGKGIIKNGF